MKERPVMKVVRLLQDMQAQLEKEKADDDAVFKSLDCWCKENDATKSKAIELAEASLEQLKSDMGEYGAKVAELRESLRQTRAKLKEDQKAMDTATAIRTQEAAAFHGEEIGLMNAVQACNEALTVLGNHHPSLEQLSAIAKSLEAMKLMQISKDSLGRDKVAVLRAFMEEAEDASKTSRLRRIPGLQSYTPQSGQILGILKQMQDEFKADLSSAQKREMNAQTEFESLRLAKESELAAGTKQVHALEQQDSEYRAKDEQAYDEYQNTQDQRDTDKEFLFNLLTKCEQKDKAYEARTKSRSEELTAIQDTIALLSNDDAFDVFEKTVSTPSFIQEKSAADVRHSQEQVRAMASAVLGRLADGRPQLALIASAVRLDSFTKVKEAIDKMVADLAKQQKEELEHRNWCVRSIATSERSEAKLTDARANLDAEIGDMKASLENLNKKLGANAEAVSTMEKEMKRASEIREAEVADFQETVADQRVTQAILQQAVDRLKVVYTSLLQRQQPGAPQAQLSGTATDPGNGPARFADYGKNAGGAKVIAMLEQVLADSKHGENEAAAAEADSQASYESFMRESNKSLLAYNKAIQTGTAEKAQVEEALIMAESDLDATQKELGDLSEALTGMHNNCDWQMKNFAARQEGRATEMDALKDVKAILSGMK